MHIYLSFSSPPLLMVSGQCVNKKNNIHAVRSPCQTFRKLATSISDRWFVYCFSVCKIVVSKPHTDPKHLSTFVVPYCSAYSHRQQQPAGASCTQPQSATASQSYPHTAKASKSPPQPATARSASYSHT